MSQTSSVTQVYGALESMEASLGGGGGFEGFYGSVTAGGVSKVYAAMQEHCDFSPSSFLVDIGGGLGRPLMHALVDPGVTNAIGIEVDEIKCLKSESVISEACNKMLALGHTVPVTPLVLHRNIEQVNQHGTLDPATHAYTFWEGVPVKARAAFGGLFAKSSTLRCVAIVQRAVRKMAPEALMEGYGFGALTLVATVKGVHMSGSQRSFTGYVFQREAPPGKPFSGPSAMLLSSLLAAPRLRQTTLPRMLRSRTRRAAAEAAPSTSESSAQTPEAPAADSDAQIPARRSQSPPARACASPDTCASAASATAKDGASDGAVSQKGPSRRAVSVKQLAAGSLRAKAAGRGESKVRAHAGKGIGPLLATGERPKDALSAAVSAPRAGPLSPSKRSGTAAVQQASPDKRTRARAAAAELKRS